MLPGSKLPLIGIIPIIWGDSGMYPDPNVPRHGKSLYKPYSSWLFMGSNPQESLENPINTMDTLLGVHPIVPWLS